MAKKKKIRKNKYKTPAKSQKKKLRSKFKIKIPFALIFLGSGALAFITVLSAILILSYSWITQTSLFNAKKIEVTGINRIQKAEILKQAEIRFGMNIMEMNLSVIHQKLIAHPWIKKAELLRVMPNKIQIRIQEHQAFGTIKFDKKYLMNKEGIIFHEFSEEFNNLPLISGLLPRDVNIFHSKVNKPETEQHSSVMEILNIQGNTFKKISEKKVHTIKVDRELGLTLLSDGQIKKVKLGFKNYEGKLNKLEEVVKFVTKNDNLIVIETIDLVNINRVVIKPATETNNNYSLKEPGGYHAGT